MDRVVPVLAFALAAAPPSALAWSPDGTETAKLAAGGLVAEVKPDPGRSSGVIHGAIDIAAPARQVWDLMLDCAMAPRLVTMVKSCHVLTTGADGAWDVREEKLAYGFPFPALRSRFRSDYEAPKLIKFTCVPGSDIKACSGEWRLEPTGNGAVRVVYDAWMRAPFPAPGFMVRNRLKRDVADALTQLRRYATSQPAGQSGTM